MFSGSLPNKWKLVISSIVFSIQQLSLPTFCKFYKCFHIYFCHFVPLNVGIAKQNPSTFLGNMEWNLVKQLENGDFYNFFHNATATSNINSNFTNAVRNLFDI